LIGDLKASQTRIAKDSRHHRRLGAAALGHGTHREVVRLYPQVKASIKLDPPLQLMAESLNKQLSRVGLTNARATVVGSTIFIEGVVDSEAELKKAEIIAQGSVRTFRVFCASAASKMIELDCEFVENLEKLARPHRCHLADPTSPVTPTSTTRRPTSSPRAGEQRNPHEHVTAQAVLGCCSGFQDGVSRTLPALW